MLNEVDWLGGLDGFSGSTVIVGLRDDNGSNYALAGMLVTGGGSFRDKAAGELQSNAGDISRCAPLRAASGWGGRRFRPYTRPG
jgi:hypothetical protein